MPRTPYSSASAGFASTSTFASSTWPARDSISRLEHRRERPARPAPLGPEVDDDRHLGGAVDDVGGECQLGHVHAPENVYPKPRLPIRERPQPASGPIPMARRADRRRCGNRFSTGGAPVTQISTPPRTQRAGRRPRGSFAFVGTPTSPTHATLAREVAVALGARGFERTDAPDAALVVNLVDPARAEAVPAARPRHVRRGALGAARAACRRARGDLPDAGARAGERLAHVRTGLGRLVHDDGARQLSRAGRRRRWSRWRAGSWSGSSRWRRRGS